MTTVLPCVPDPPGLRERKKQATRQALATAALQLAVRHGGPENVLVEDIAAAAGVSARTFSNYFASKPEAICAAAMDRSRGAGAALAARPAAEPLRAAITAAMLEVHAAADGVPDRDWIAGLRVVIRSPELRGEFLKSRHAMQDALAAAIAGRTGADPVTDMTPQVLAAAVTAAALVAMERWLCADPPVALAPLIGRALRALTGALADPDDPSGGLSPLPGKP